MKLHQVTIFEWWEDWLEYTNVGLKISPTQLARVLTNIGIAREMRYQNMAGETTRKSFRTISDMPIALAT